MSDSCHGQALVLLALHSCHFVQGADVPQLLNAHPGAGLRLLTEELCMPVSLL